MDTPLPRVTSLEQRLEDVTMQEKIGLRAKTTSTEHGRIQLLSMSMTKKMKSGTIPWKP